MASKPFLFVFYSPIHTHSGQELYLRLLEQVGLSSSLVDCVYLTMRKDVVYDDKDAVTSDQKALVETIIESRRPRVVVTFGEAPFFLLTGHSSHYKWRGSQFNKSLAGYEYWLIPTYHPVEIMRQFEWLTVAGMDLTRAKRIQNLPPRDVREYDFITSPSEAQVYEALDGLIESTHAVDLETLKGHITCIGISLTLHRAICIPLTQRHSLEPYWEPEAERRILTFLHHFFQRKDLSWVFQNGIYDLQYIVRYLGVRPKINFDTMVAQQLRYNPLPKSLDFIASQHCENYIYWKDDIEEAHKYWEYNCLDCIYTIQAAVVLAKAVEEAGKGPQLDFQMKQVDAALTLSLRGFACDQKYKNSLIGPMLEMQNKHQEWINTAVGRQLNVKSPKQMQEFFYGDMQIKPVKNRKTKGVSTDAKALAIIAQREPILRPLIERIEILRSIGVYVGTFIQMLLDRDDKIRCVFNPAGPETFRWSSSKSAFNTGTNLQNIPGEDKAHLFPNIRKMFIPSSPDRVIAEADLKQADLQIVAWEADDADLKAKFREGVDIHTENAKDIYGTTDPDLIAKYRPMTKAGVHATNYVTTGVTLAKTLGLTVKEADAFIARWFSIHPGIKDWHNDIEERMQLDRFIENRFGFRRYFYDRVEGSLPEAVAWIPQSTVALVISHAVITLSEQPKYNTLLSQVHDSVVTEFRAVHQRPALRELRDAMRVTIPYDDPLIIGADFKASPKSWGDCEKVEVM